MADLPKVACRICALKGVDNLVNPKGLSAHLRAHKKDGWTRKKYEERWGSEDFVDYQPTPPQVAKKMAVLAPARDKYNAELRGELSEDTETLLSDPNLELLDADERVFYEQFYSLVLQAVDRDEVQMPEISSLALDMVIQKRLRKTQLQNTKKKEYTASQDLEAALEKTTKRIQNSMKALCISREMLLKTREQWKSTAAGLISGYLDELERLSPEALDAMRIDEQRVYGRMKPRIQKMLLQFARDLEPEPEQEENSDGSHRAVASLEEALANAGFASF